MSLPSWNGALDSPRSSNSRRTRETWILRGFALMTLFNLILLFKLHRRVETKTPLDDFQMLWVVFSRLHHSPPSHPFRFSHAIGGSALIEYPLPQ